MGRGGGVCYVHKHVCAANVQSNCILTIISSTILDVISLVPSASAAGGKASKKKGIYIYMLFYFC